MEIIYKKEVLEKECKNFKKAQKAYNKIVAEKLHSTITFIESATTLMDIKNMPMFKLHPLKDDRKGTYAIDLGRKIGYRLIIVPLNDNKEEWELKDINKIYNSTRIILAMEVTNHYE